MSEVEKEVHPAGFPVKMGLRELVFRESPQGATEDRTAKTLLGFFRTLGKARSGRLRFVCSDMWKPYLKVIAKKAGQALHVLDRFHIMVKMNKAIDAPSPLPTG